MYKGAHIYFCVILSIHFDITVLIMKHLELKIVPELNQELSFLIGVLFLFVLAEKEPSHASGNRSCSNESFGIVESDG